MQGNGADVEKRLVREVLSFYRLIKLPIGSSKTTKN